MSHSLETGLILASLAMWRSFPVVCYLSSLLMSGISAKISAILPEEPFLLHYFITCYISSLAEVRQSNELFTSK